MRTGSFNISQPSTFKAIGHTLVENEMCKDYRTDASLGDAGICIQNKDGSGHDGDPIMVI